MVLLIRSRVVQVESGLLFVLDLKHVVLLLYGADAGRSRAAFVVRRVGQRLVVDEIVLVVAPISRAPSHFVLFFQSASGVGEPSGNLCGGRAGERDGIEWLWRVAYRSRRLKIGYHACKLAKHMFFSFDRTDKSAYILRVRGGAKRLAGGGSPRERCPNGKSALIRNLRTSDRLIFVFAD